MLRAIANSPHDLQPIFDTILANATRLCRAELGALKLWEGNSYRIVSQRNLPPSFYAGWEEGRLFPVLPGSPHARVAESRSSVHVADLTADQSYVDGTSVSVAWAEPGVRTYLLTPLLKEDELVGLIVILRTQVQPFTDNQVNLVTTFAAEATVALESIRRERRYRDIQMELAHGNRSTSPMGQLTASITHEVNQPIGAVSNRLGAARNFLDRTPPDLEEIRAALAGAQEATDRASAIIDRMRALIQKAPTLTDSMDINEAAREVIELIRGEAVKNRVSLTQFTQGLPTIAGDRVQLQQVVLNLILNALQAMNGVGRHSDRCSSLPGKPSPMGSASGCKIPAQG